MRIYSKGFTIIEIVIVITILGLFAVIAIPRFLDLSSQSRISAAKGILGSVRSAVALKYIENARGNQSSAIPSMLTPDMFQDQKVPIELMTNSDSVTVISSEAEITDGTGWAYDSVYGRVWINNSQYANF